MSYLSVVASGCRSVVIPCNDNDMTILASPREMAIPYDSVLIILLVMPIFAYLTYLIRPSLSISPEEMHPPCG